MLWGKREYKRNVKGANIYVIIRHCQRAQHHRYTRRRRRYVNLVAKWHHDIERSKSSNSRSWIHQPLCWPAAALQRLWVWVDTIRRNHPYEQEQYTTSPMHFQRPWETRSDMPITGNHLVLPNGLRIPIVWFPMHCVVRASRAKISWWSDQVSISRWKQVCLATIQSNTMMSHTPHIIAPDQVVATYELSSA